MADSAANLRTSRVMRAVAASTAIAAALCAASPALAGGPAVAAHTYRVVHGWPSVPEGQVLGWVVSGVGVDSHGDVLVFHRAAREWNSDELSLTPILRATVVRSDGKTGAFKASWVAWNAAFP